MRWRRHIVPLSTQAVAILDEVLGFPPHLIEHQLAHAVRDPLGRAYNRTAHLPERRKMLQDWVDYLDKLEWVPGDSETIRPCSSIFAMIR